MMAEKKVTAKVGQEVWELTTGGRVWVETTDAKGIAKAKSVVGRGGRLRISTEDRELAQERTRDSKNDPFTNGTLVRIDADQNEDENTASTSALTDEDLLKVLAKKQGGVFKKAVEEFSEVTFRRLRTLMRDNDDVTSAQTKAMQEVYDEKYNPNKDWQDPGGEDPNSIAATFPEVNLSSGAERKDK
jgi:hypothetical protein